MGMTRAFYFIRNQGYSRDQLKEMLSGLSGGVAFPPGLSGILNQKLSEMRQRTGEGDAGLELLSAGLGGNRIPGSEPVIAYKEDAGLLPFFEAGRCEGNIASSRENGALALCFKAPVLSFSVMDSDVLFVSYCDKEKGVAYDCARPNSPGREDEMYDTDIYSSDFPAFLLEYCKEPDREKLRQIWESDAYIFAEEKMEDVGGMLGVEFMYEEKDIPEGYEAL